MSAPRFTLFGVDCSHWSPVLQLGVGVGGVMLCFVATSYAQEMAVKGLGFNHSMIMSASIPLVGVIGGLLGNGYKGVKAPMKWAGVMGMLSLVTIGLSNYSLYYLNYPTQIVFKSAKLIPVMIMGICILNKRYSLADYIAAALLAVGISVSVIADATVAPEYNIVGVIIISGALVADAVIGNTQEKVMKEFGSSELEVMSTSSAAALLVWFCLLIGFESTSAVMRELHERPVIVFWIVVYSVFNYFGMFFVLSMIERFGAATTVFVTSCRKAVSMVISVIFFPKTLTLLHWLGALLVGGGIALNAKKSGKKVDNPASGGGKSPTVVLDDDNNKA